MSSYFSVPVVSVWNCAFAHFCGSLLSVGVCGPTMASEKTRFNLVFMKQPRKSERISSKGTTIVEGESITQSESHNAPSPDSIEEPVLTPARGFMAVDGAAQTQESMEVAPGGKL